MISEKGRLGDTNSIKLLLRIREQKLTGILYLRRQGITKTLYFNNGNFTWATSSDPEDGMLEIFIQKKIIGSEIANQLRKEQSEEASGRFLVEKGLISLEELINGSREQLRRIVLSIFNWNEGEFQFTLDKPPERIVSLDIDILRLIWESMQHDFNNELIWKELGSFHSRLKLNPERSGKISLPQLLVEVVEFLKTSATIETIINNFNSYNPQLVVRGLFLLKQMEIIIRDEQIESESTPPIRPESVEFPPKAQEEQSEEEEPLFDVAEIEARLKGKEPIPFSLDTPAKQSRFWLYLMIVAIFAISAGIVYLLLSEKSERQKMLEALKQPVEEKSAPPKQQEANITENEIFQPEIPQISPKSNEKQVLPAIEQPERVNPSVSKKNEAQTTQVESKNQIISARKALLDGNLLLAADLFKKELQDLKPRYSILLELDCLRESVLTARNKFPSLDNFMILPRQRNDQTCFLVLYGRYNSKQEAAEDLKKIPEFFWKQSSPPQVIELTPYL